MSSHPSMRVLVVDDDFDTRALLSDVLELDGFVVDGAGTAQETLDRRDLAEYLAIILDRRLPDGSADELLPRLRMLAPDAYIIIATGHADLDSTIGALRQGAADYILKPVNPDLLRASLGRLRQLREATQRANQAERLASIGQMVSVVAHESRNALQRIRARVELMRLSLDDQPELLQDLDAIQAANDSLRSMFDELREYSAPIVLDKEQANLVTTIQRAWESLRGFPRRMEAGLQVNLRNTRPICCVDTLKLEQVFRNLFENAISECTEPAEIIVTLSTVDSLGDDGAIRVSVRDNGPGFSDEHRRQAFEPFFTTKNAGTGLGLAISKRIVDAHQGQIVIAPSAGRGAEILITLPVILELRGQPPCQPHDDLHCRVTADS